MTDTIDRFTFLFQRRFPGFSDAIAAKVNPTRLGPRGLSDEKILSFLDESLNWDLRGCSIKRPTRSAFENDEVDGDKFLAARVLFLKTWITEARAYDKYLNNLNDLEFDALYAKEVLSVAAAESVQQLDLDRDRFFSGPLANADFGLWIKLGAWIAEEAVALSLGKDPAQVTLKSLKKIPSASPFAKDFKFRLKLVERAVSIGDLPAHMAPHEFAIWAIARLNTIPEQIEELSANADMVTQDEIAAKIASLNAEIARLEALSILQEETIQTLRLSADDMIGKSRTAWAKLILGLARHHHFTHRDTINYKGIHLSLLEYPKVQLSAGAVRGIIDKSFETLDIFAKDLK